MDLHEYQSKSLMREFNILNLLDGYSILKEQDIESVLKEAFSKVEKQKKPIVVKAQVHAGGRGKAGGVRVCKTFAEAVDYSKSLFGHRLVTKQTGKNGQLVSALYCEVGCDIEKEFYLSMLVDREKKCVSIIVSTEGGMDIEEVAHNNPEKIYTINVEFCSDYMPFYTRKIMYFLSLDYQKYNVKLHELMKKLYDFFLLKDLSLLEINPLVLTKDHTIDNIGGDFIVLDAKLNIDENALFRQSKIFNIRDKTQEDELESKAKDVNLSYVKLDGEIGCMVNGAGLAMATMDIVQLYGAKPANFLDVGGGANQDSVEIALNIIIEDRSVKAILINIFGGIVQCDMIAKAIIGAASSLISKGKILPKIVVRLSGTNSEVGLKIIEDSDLDILTALDLDDAAKKVVSLIKG